MNIFVLDENPKIAASMHCDQHLSKMILESAQLLSNSARKWSPHRLAHIIYAPTHLNHPCTFWIRKHIDNALWVISLARELNYIRLTRERSISHASMVVIEAIAKEYTEMIGWSDSPQCNFEFVGDAAINQIPNMSVPMKYQAYYLLKAMDWKAHGRPMTFKGREIPAFLKGYTK